MERRSVQNGDELERRLHELSLLYEMTSTLGASADLDKSLDGFLDCLVRALVADIGAVFTAPDDSQAGDLVLMPLRRAIGIATKHWPNITMPMEVLGSDRRGVLLRPSPDRVHQILAPFERETPVVIVVALDSEEGLLGALLLAWFVPRDLSAEETRMLLRMAARAAFVVDHHRASVGLRKTTLRLQALNAELEQRVQDRTKKLDDANHELEQHVERLRSTQEQLVRAGKMAAVGQLAAGVAHEINNPLTVILGFAQGIERRLPEGAPFQMPIQSIVREGLRCKSLVQELLTFSRTAKKSVDDVDPNDLLRGAGELLEPRARSQGVRLVVEATSTVPVLKGSRAQLQQAILNLGNNALDAVSETGEVLLVSRNSEGGGVVLEVRDTGRGIPPHIRPRIFEPFFTTKEVGKGTGLGLSLALEVVQQHGGTIDVQSEPGGTTMVVRLPANGAAAQGTAIMSNSSESTLAGRDQESGGART